jgi:hypothetical protein
MARLGKEASAVLLAFCVAATVAACGSSKKSTGGGGGGSTTQSAADARSAATGDIPDNQVFLTYKDAGAGYSISYPEGWTRRGGANDITFQDKANVIHIVVSKGGPPTPADVQADLSKLKASDPAVQPKPVQKVTLNGQPVLKVTYTTRSGPNPVTGKRVPLTVDRYYYSKGGRRAYVDLGTAVGVDNVDAYRMISRSFKWQ